MGAWRGGVGHASGAWTTKYVAPASMISVGETIVTGCPEHRVNFPREECVRRPRFDAFDGGRERHATDDPVIRTECFTSTFAEQAPRLRLGAHI
jgi:hypothetical protein